MIRVAFDSNILVYLAGGRYVPTDDTKIAAALKLLVALRLTNDLVAPIQALGEAATVLRRKFKWSAESIDALLARWDTGFDKVPTSFAALRDGVALAAAHRLQHWDAVIVAAAASGNCTILLSEDMQHGFVWRGTTIINPFADPPHPLLAELLAS